MPRTLRLLAPLLALALLAGACGDDGSSGGGGGRDGAAEAGGTTTPAEEGAFPVRVEHKFGTTEIDAEPTRIVALGYTDLDFVLALGSTPVAARYPQFGDEEDAVQPWAADAAGGAVPEVLNFTYGELGFEAIKRLNPDLVLAVTSGITEEEYDTLAEIAPTVAQTDEYVDFGMPWQATTRQIGRALGRSDRAEELVDEVEAAFAAAREEHPELEGLSVASAYHAEDEIQFFASEDIRARFFVDLGMEVPAELDEIAGDAFYGSLSTERIDLIDADVLVWSQMQFTEGGRDAIEADPLVQGLDATREERALYIGGEVDDAFQVSTVLSLPVALDGILPMLARAADGDPETIPTPKG